MTKKLIKKLISLTVWLTGVLVSLAVGFGMVDGVLTVMWLPEIVTVVAGWIVVVLTILAVVLALIDNS